MRFLGTLAVAVLFACASYGLFWFRQKLKSTPTSQINNRPLIGAAVGCLFVFIVVNVSDWPGTVLSRFWADHAIIAATASTLPLLGVGYFAFEAYDQRVQTDLDSKVAATGRGGVVDHLVDVDVALALLRWDWLEVKERWPDFDLNGRPLRWLRQDRHLLGRAAETVLATDPRSVDMTYEPQDELWRHDLVDQCVRRIMAGIKEWGPILTRSHEGQQDLVSLGEVRLALLPIADRSAAISPRQVNDVQRRCRELALSFESRSMGDAAIPTRPEVLSLDEAHT